MSCTFPISEEWKWMHEHCRRVYTQTQKRIQNPDNQINFHNSKVSQCRHNWNKFEWKRKKKSFSITFSSYTTNQKKNFCTLVVTNRNTFFAFFILCQMITKKVFTSLQNYFTNKTLNKFLQKTCRFVIYRKINWNKKRNCPNQN